MNSKINLNEISDFLSNMRKDNNVLLESTITTVTGKSVLQKPYPDSDLHSLTFEELSTKLYESRREQHRIPQFSAQEFAHLKFVDEAVAVLNYSASNVNELSTALLGKYKSAASKAASAADAAGDFKTGNKRFSGVMKATKKQFANDDRMLKKESEELEETFAVKHDVVAEGDVFQFPPKHPWYTEKNCPKCGKGPLVDGKTSDGRVKCCMVGCGAVYSEPNTNKAARDGRMLKKESVELDEASVESKIASLEKKINDARDAIGLAREKRKMKGQRQQGPREMALQKKIDDVRREIDDIKRSTKNESEELDEFIEYKHLAIHAVMHKQKQSNLAAGVEHLAKKNAAMTAHSVAKKAGNHEEAAKHLETANAHHTAAMKRHDVVQELSKKMAALHKN